MGPSDEFDFPEGGFKLNSKHLLSLARAAFDGPDLWVDSLVLRRYTNGLPDSLRIDDSTAEADEVSGDFSHVLVVLETRLSTLLARCWGCGATATAVAGGLIAGFQPAFIAAADAQPRERSIR